jgi:hypothetical protein
MKPLERKAATVAPGDDVWADGSGDVVWAQSFSGMGRTRLLQLAYAKTLVTAKVGRRRLFAKKSLVALLRASAAESV